MRGCLIMLVDGDGINDPSGSVQVLDWYSRKQPHVCRSTFAAELHAALDAVNQGIVIQGLLTETELGAMTAAQLCDLQTAGRLSVALHLCIDAKSVFDSVTTDKPATPNDKHLLVHCLMLREFLHGGLLSVIWWIDTLDMLSGGPTKRVIDRTAILALLEKCSWRICGQTPARWPKSDHR